MPKRPARSPSPTPSASSSAASSSSRPNSSDGEYASDSGNHAAQWVDEDELDGLVDSEEDEFATGRGENRSEDEDEEKLDVDGIKEEMHSIAFGTLAKAQKLLRSQNRNEASSHTSESDDGSGSDAAEEESDGETNDVGTSSSVRKPAGDRNKRVKRVDKHAPMEVSSKKAVSRRRQVVDVPKIERRDPRFSSLSGELDPTLFAQSYSFLNNIRTDEVASLKTSLSRARKLLATSPAHLRDERAEEVRKLERALKRTESTVERDRRERREREVLSGKKREERGKVGEGKGQWFMKESEKRKVLTEARFDALEKEGGRQAVKKAVQKRQMKISQKEKKSRPDGGPQLGRGGGGARGRGGFGGSGRGGFGEGSGRGVFGGGPGRGGSGESRGGGRGRGRGGERGRGTSTGAAFAGRTFGERRTGAISDTGHTNKKTKFS